MIKIELDEKYRESLDLLKQVIPDVDGSEISDDTKMIEVLIESFMWFLSQEWEWCCCWDDCECGDDCDCEDWDNNCGCK